MEIYQKYLVWNECTHSEGVVIGADELQEWLIPWWRSHFEQENDYPVLVVDFGLSDRMRSYCEEWAKVIPLKVFDLYVEKRETIDEERIGQWEATYGTHFWDTRHVWFKKPLACLRSPFEKSIWIDLDCEIRGSLAPLFKELEKEPEIALAKDPLLYVPFTLYNSGVLGFRHGAQIVSKWAECSFTRTGEFHGDQDLLSSLIHETGAALTELDPVWNWSRLYGNDEQAEVVHWHGEYGRFTIYDQLRKNDHFMS